MHDTNVALNLEYSADPSTTFSLGHCNVGCPLVGIGVQTTFLVGLPMFVDYSICVPASYWLRE
jgi:hypothetical protein